jgi:hypothetical protein
MKGANEINFYFKTLPELGSEPWIHMGSHTKMFLKAKI